MLQVRGVSRCFPGVRALDGVDLHVRAGEIHALVGENGAGKSTLVKVLGGALRPDAGQVLLQGEPLPLGDPQAVRARGVGIIYQEFSLVDGLSVAENVFLGAEPTRAGLLDRAAMQAAVRPVLASLGCAVDPAARVGGLSVGVQQLVEVARALAGRARLLVFDEPSATLTAGELEHLFRVLRDLRQRGLGLVYISHRLEEVFSLADRVTVLRDGRTVARADVRGLAREQLIRWMVGRELQETTPAPRPVPGAPVLEVRGLSRPPRLRHADLLLRRGEILGLGGLVGAGRTDLGRTLVGDLLATGGEVRLGGVPVRFTHPGQALDAGLGYLTEDRKARGLFGGLDLVENVTLASLGDFVRHGLLSRGTQRAAALRACRRFDVRAPDPDRPVTTLSGGNQQKALLARLLRRPLQAVILDEPTRGVDVGGRAEVHRLVAGLAAEGLAVLLISSDLPELLALCDRVAVMRAGRTVGLLERHELSQQRVMELATGGDACAAG